VSPLNQVATSFPLRLVSAARTHRRVRYRPSQPIHAQSPDAIRRNCSTSSPATVQENRLAGHVRSLRHPTLLILDEMWGFCRSRHCVSKASTIDSHDYATIIPSPAHMGSEQTK